MVVRLTHFPFAFNAEFDIREQLGRLTHYAFDAVLGMLCQFSELIHILKSSSLRVPSRCQAINRSHVCSVSTSSTIRFLSVDSHTFLISLFCTQKPLHAFSLLKENTLS